MDNLEHPVIGFGLAYSNQLIYCEGVMSDNYYDVLFNGSWTTTIVYNEDRDWSRHPERICRKQLSKKLV